MDIQVTNRKHIHVFILFLLLFRVILGLRKIRISFNPSDIENINETETEDSDLLDWQGL